MPVGSFKFACIKPVNFFLVNLYETSWSWHTPPLWQGTSKKFLKYSMFYYAKLRGLFSPNVESKHKSKSIIVDTYRLAMSLPEQSSMSRSQRSPSNPGEQVQRKPSTFHNIINTSFYRSLYCIHAMLFFSKNETLGKILNDLISNYIFVQLTIYVCIYQLFRFSAAVCKPNPVGHILSPPSS